MISIDTQRKKIIGVVLLVTLVVVTTQVLLPLMDHQASLRQRISGAEQKLNHLLKLEKQHTMLAYSGLASSDTNASEPLIAQLRGNAQHFKIQQAMTKTSQLAGIYPEAVNIEFTRVSLAMFVDYLLSLEQKGLSINKLSLITRGGGIVDISMTVSR